MVFLFAGFVVSIEVLRDIRVPFTHIVLRPGADGPAARIAPRRPRRPVPDPSCPRPSAPCPSCLGPCHRRRAARPVARAAPAASSSSGRWACCSTRSPPAARRSPAARRLERDALPDLVPDRRGLDGRLARPRHGVPARADPVRLHLRAVPLPAPGSSPSSSGTAPTTPAPGTAAAAVLHRAPGSWPWRSPSRPTSRTTRWPRIAAVAVVGATLLSIVLMAHDRRCRRPATRVDPATGQPVGDAVPGPAPPADARS